MNNINFLYEHLLYNKIVQLIHSFIIIYICILMIID